MPETDTLSTLRVVVPTVTVKSLLLGTATWLESRFALKVRVSVAPLTDALWNAGAVALATVWSVKVSTSFELASWSGLVPGLV